VACLRVINRPGTSRGAGRGLSMGKWYRLAVAAGFIWTAWWSYDHRLDFEALMQPAPENQKVL